MVAAATVTLTADVVILRPRADDTNHKNTYEILLQQRDRPPFEECYALLGGTLNKGERILDCAYRAIYQQTGIKLICPDLVDVYDAPQRDPQGRRRMVSVAYTVLVDPATVVVPRNKAANLHWFSVQDLPLLAFDHRTIIDHALHYLRGMRKNEK